MQPPPAKKCLSLKLKKKRSESSVPDSFVSPEKSLDKQEKLIPENTKVNTCWAVKNFEDWVLSYNSRHPDDKCPDGVLLSDNPAELLLWMQRYVTSM